MHSDWTETHDKQAELHYFKSIPPQGQYNIDYLHARFNGEYAPDVEECGVLEQTIIRRPNCGKVFQTCFKQLINRLLGKDHPQGPGALVMKGCGVIFHILIPEDLTSTPYILFTTHRVHTHPPPPPNITPKRLVSDITDLVKRIRDPNLTLGITR